MHRRRMASFLALCPVQLRASCKSRHRAMVVVVADVGASTHLNALRPNAWLLVRATMWLGEAVVATGWTVGN
jgi:hypothetical protein